MRPTYVPTNDWAISALGLGEMLANLTAFRVAVGATNAEQAWSSIYLFQASDIEDEDAPPDNRKLIHPRPRAIISFNSGSASYAGIGEWDGDTELELILELLTPDQYADNWNDQSLWAGDTFSGIETGLRNLRQSDPGGLGYWPFREIRAGFEKTIEYQEIEKFWGCSLVLTGRGHA